MSSMSPTIMKMISYFQIFAIIIIHFCFKPLKRLPMALSFLLFVLRLLGFLTKIAYSSLVVPESGSFSRTINANRCKNAGPQKGTRPSEAVRAYRR